MDILDLAVEAERTAEKTGWSGKTRFKKTDSRVPLWIHNACQGFGVQTNLARWAAFAAGSRRIGCEGKLIEEIAKVSGLDGLRRLERETWKASQELGVR